MKAKQVQPARETKSVKARAPAGIRVKDLMTADVHSCRPEEPLSAAARLMWERDCGAVPVVDERVRVVGMITDRDICMATYTQGRPPQDLAVGAVMATTPHACRPEDSLARAEELMSAHQVRRLPVIDDESRLVGILSLADLVRAAASTASTRRPTLEEVTAPLAAVSAPRRTGKKRGA